MTNQGLDEFVGSIMGAGGGAGITLFKGKTQGVPVFRADKCWFIFQQAFIHRPEFFNIQCGVVDADGLPGVSVIIYAERTKTVQNGAIVEKTSAERADGVRAEQIAGKRGKYDLWSSVAGYIKYKEREKAESPLIRKQMEPLFYFVKDFGLKFFDLGPVFRPP